MKAHAADESVKPCSEKQFPVSGCLSLSFEHLLKFQERLEDQHHTSGQFPLSSRGLTDDIDKNHYAAGLSKTVLTRVPSALTTAF
jgi:hypothetical protein